MSRLVVVLLLACVCSCFALNCYVCGTENCKEKILPSQLKTCGENYTTSTLSLFESIDSVERADTYHCVALTLVASASNNKTTLRGCLPSDTATVACLLATSVIQQMKSATIQICNTDGCNGSSMTYISMAAFGVVLVHLLNKF